MIAVVKSADRYHADMGWLSTYWHFSFAEYHDPANMGWGSLRVFNDDVIRPGKGFGPHPHRDMEIIAYVLDGTLEHRDNQGNHGVIHPGEVQVMSAATGIVHAEYNAWTERPVHLLQPWIRPRTQARKPRWEQRRFTPERREGRLLPVVSSGACPRRSASIRTRRSSFPAFAVAGRSSTRAGRRGGHTSSSFRDA